jgi:hypothetical protein
VSRRNTIERESYRVWVVDQTDRVTHDSTFRTLDKAKAYYDSISIAGSTKQMQHRAAGASRYKALSDSTLRMS